jgi:hypothetical protein
MNEPTCPKCGCIIDYWESVEESTDVDYHKILCTGGCQHCGTDYQWWDVYSFSHVEDLEEVE